MSHPIPQAAKRPARTDLDRDIDRAVMAVARLTRRGTDPDELERARQAASALTLRRQLLRALDRVPALTAEQRADLSSLIWSHGSHEGQL